MCSMPSWSSWLTQCENGHEWPRVAAGTVRTAALAGGPWLTATGRPEDFAGAGVFVASGAGYEVTGQMIMWPGDRAYCGLSVTCWTSYCQQAGLTAGRRLPCPLRIAAMRAARKFRRPWGLSSVHRSGLN
jgi:hypothetical protein